MKFKFFFLLISLVSFSAYGNESTEKWDIFEITLKGPSEGNPYKDVQLKATFSHGNKTMEIHGFYDGEGVYKIRFMPDTEGEWSYITSSNSKDLNKKTGKFTCIKNTRNNHGQVKVANKYHFAYADGHPFNPFGTTIYVWHHQYEATQEKTLKTLTAASFNKVRMLIFPWSSVNEDNPELNVLQTDTSGKQDLERFNPVYWNNLEKRLLQLRDLGIEADIIVFNAVPISDEKFYLQYLTSRISAFRNVWWCMANEYNLDKSRTQEDWDLRGNMLAELDPYHHLLSCHNHPAKEFDWSKDYITHVSCQYADQVFVASLLQKYQKPVINDEAQYEGDHFCHWGNISAREMVHRFWLGAVNGIYTTHGETYHTGEWSGPGGVYEGESPERIAFLRKIMEEGPVEGINNYKPGEFWQNLAAGNPDNYLLLYFGVHQPHIWYFNFPEGTTFTVELIDPWDMTIEPMGGTFKGECNVKLPRKPYQALRLKRTNAYN
jgi:hypothetical protein